MKNKLRQILYDMRTQPVIAWVTVIGTALSIFLIMTLVMMQQVSIISFSPESHRDRMLYGRYVHLESISEEGQSASGSLSYDIARKLYGNLKGVDAVSYMNSEYEPVDVKGTSGDKFAADRRLVDEGFWRVYDFDLVDGRYFTADEVSAERHLAIITESLARRLFSGDRAIGRHFELDHNDFEVIGVVGDVSKLASNAYGEVFAPISHAAGWWDALGEMQVALLVSEGVDFQSVRNQVKGNYARLNTELKADDRRAVYHEAPFDQETVCYGDFGSNTTPDTSGIRNLHILLYAILLIVPAINLSSMLHSRLRRRVSEFGVRRAFGCTRLRIASDIIVENLLVTLAGGIIGFIMVVLFALFYDGLYTSPDGEAARPALSLILDWHILLYAFAACFILNILSASVPAWQAARLSPVSAINSK